MRSISLATRGQNRVVSTQKNIVIKDKRTTLAVCGTSSTMWVLDACRKSFLSMRHDPDLSMISALVSAHSTKPALVYDRLQAHYLDDSCIRLFSRPQRTGWTMYGNEAGGVGAEKKVA